MGRKGNKLVVELNLTEAARLAEHLSTLVAKGSLSTCPAWARNIIWKLSEAAREQYPVWTGKVEPGKAAE